MTWPAAFTRLLPLVLLVALAGAAPAAGTYTLAEALREMHSLDALLRPADPPRRFAQLSGWDRNLGNFDQGNFQREDGDEVVLMDVNGPGVLTRLWTAEPMGYLRFYWDGAEEHQFAITWAELAKGELPPLIAPFVSTAGGGCTMRFPITFEKGLKVTLSGQTWCHWQIHYQYFAPGAAVSSYIPGQRPPPGATDEFTAAATAWNDPAAAHVSSGNSTQRQVALHAGAPAARHIAGHGEVVTEISYEHLSGGEIPAGLLIALPTSGGVQRLPWRELCGTFESAGDAPSLLMGRKGDRTWFRVPFRLPAGGEISFEWDGGAEGEAIGTFTISTMSSEEAPAAPELLLVRHVQTGGSGTPFTPPALKGNARLLHLASSFRAEHVAYYMEGDESIRLEGERHPSIRGTGVPHLFDGGIDFNDEEFSTAIAALPVIEDAGRRTVARTAWWPLGIPFAGSLEFQIEAPPTHATMVLVGQSFGPPIAVPPPSSPMHDITIPVGSQQVTGIDAAGLPTLREAAPPLTATCRPFEVALDVDATIRGTFAVNLAPYETDQLSVMLDLPFGWRGRLTGAGVENDVFDIGWPPIELHGPAAGEHSFAYEVFPPDVLAAGQWVVQLRAEARLRDGSVHRVAHPVRITAAPRGPAAHKWEAGEWEVADDGSLRLTLPPDFEARVGDVLAADVRATAPPGWSLDVAMLEFEPSAHAPADQRLLGEVLPHVGEPGHATGLVQLGGQWHRAWFPVGRSVAWVGAEGALRIKPPESALEFEVRGAQLLRHPELPPLDGWMRRIPYVESPRGSFHLPRNKVLLEGAELRGKMRRVVATPQDRFNPELRPRRWLENVEAGPLKWELAEGKHRHDWLSETVSVLFASRWGGERIAIHDERFVGEQFFAIQFGYGPWCGRVGVRDCEGRLVGAQDLYMNQPSVFPQYLWVALPVPSRDGWIYLESLGNAPGSFECRIPIQKVMVVGDIKR